MEDRTDRARGSRGSFRLSNLVQAGMGATEDQQRGAIKVAAHCQHCMQHQLPPPLLMLPQSESDHSNNIRPSRANTRIAGEHTETSPDPTADSPPLNGANMGQMVSIAK